jgi:hypothetical protein
MQQAGHRFTSLPGWRTVVLGATVFALTLPLWLR